MLLIVLIIAFGIHYWHVSQTYESTNDAYINADTTQIAAQVAGPNLAIQPYFEHFGAREPHTLTVLSRQLATQAEMTAMLDVFKRITWSFILMLPLLLLLRGDRGS